MFELGERLAPLGNADAESCADYCVTLLSDYARMVTMQTLFHDGGYSAMGVSDALVEALGMDAPGAERAEARASATEQTPGTEPSGDAG